MQSPKDTRTKTKYQLIRLKNYIRSFRGSFTDIRVIELLDPLEALANELWEINQTQELNDVEFKLIESACADLEHYMKILGDKKE
jgi:hypothetical protein